MRSQETADSVVSDLVLLEMHRVGGGLFAAGGALVAIVALLSSWPQMHLPTLSITAAVALGAGFGLLALGRWRPLPGWTLPWLALLGTLNITATVVASGPHGAGAFGVLYVFVTVFSFNYFPIRVAVTEGALTAVFYAAALAFVDVNDPAAVWLVVTMANIVIGVLIGRGGKRVRDLLVSEQASVHRMRELDELRTAFLRAVSHELRTPLTAVVGNAETLQLRRPQLSETQIDLLIHKIGTNADRLQELLTNLLDIDRITRGIVQPQLASTDIGMLVRQVVDQMHAPNHTIEVFIDDPVIVAVEASKLERIVENLVGNAIRHTPAESTVQVRVRCNDEGMLLTVDDDGPGIPADIRNMIFEPFEQGPGAAHAASPGTGIGLSLVAKFAELHGGRAWAIESPSGGASFNVLLPDGERAHDPSGVLENAAE